MNGGRHNERHTLSSTDGVYKEEPDDALKPMTTIINPARLFLTLAFLSTWILAAAPTNEIAASKPTSKWTTEDVLKTEWGASFKISPDCRKVVWGKAVPDKERTATSAT